MITPMSFQQYGDRVEQWVRRLDAPAPLVSIAAALFALLLLLLFPVSWISNEEVYFVSARMQAAPATFSAFHAIFDHSRARIAFDWPLGLLVEALDYERAHIVARIAMALLYAASLGVLFRAMRLSALDAVAVVTLFCVSGQTFVGEEWLFRGIESKTVAYAAVITALGVGLQGRWLLASVLSVLATYFHFLVGGYWALALIVLAWFEGASPRLVAKMMGIYLVSVAPLAALVASEQLRYAVPGAPVDLNQVFALRNAHHVAPFTATWRLWGWSVGLLAAVTAALVLPGVATRLRRGGWLKLVVLLLLYVPLAFTVSFLDRHSLWLAKFYMFRPAALTLLLAFSTAFWALRTDSTGRERVVVKLFLCPLIAIFLWAQLQARVQEYRHPTHQSLPDLPELIAAIERESRPDEIVLIEPRNEGAYPYVRLPRQLPRPTLVTKKYDPTTPRDMLRWHDLMQFRARLFSRGCQSPLALPIGLLLVFEPSTLHSVGSCGTVVWQGQSAYLIRVDDKWRGGAPASR